MPTATVRGLERLRCSVCNNVILEREVACDADSMPVLYFTGDYTAATNAKNEVEMEVTRSAAVTFIMFFIIFLLSYFKRIK